MCRLACATRGPNAIQSKRRELITLLGVAAVAARGAGRSHRPSFWCERAFRYPLLPTKDGPKPTDILSFGPRGPRLAAQRGVLPPVSRDGEDHARPTKHEKAAGATRAAFLVSRPVALTTVVPTE